MGALALYALILVSFSSWLRRRLSYAVRLWLRTLSFAVFLAATLHGVLAGNDSAHPWMRAVSIASAATVALLVSARLLIPTPTARPAARASPAPSSPLQ